MRARAARNVPADIVAAARRIEERGALRLPVSVHAEAEPHITAIVTDVTTRGCRIELDRALPVGAHITIIIRATLIGGWISWCEKDVIGVEFGARLLPKILKGMLTAID